ncbi:MAG: tetratricopeptide repeat protein, partial [Myxococcota bacterium]
MITTLLLAALSGSARAQESDLLKLEEDSARLQVVIEGLQATPVESLAVNKKKRFNDRLEQAIDLFLADDYVNVGMLLYDVVEDPDYQNETRYNEALYYLAQSLYQMNQLGASRVYFQRLVERRDRRYLDDAVRQLILVADKTRNWEKIDEQVEVLRARGTLPPVIAYIYMKSLLRQGEPARSKEVLSSVPKENQLWAKAAYVSAVCDVQLGRFSEARSAFDELRKIPNAYQDASEIRDLSAMNVGRLYLEEGDLTNAIDAYQQVSRDSDLFERALFEVTWTFVRAASQSESEREREVEYKKAVRALDILLLAERERPVVPEARLLLGNIRLRMDAFEGATEAFTRVVDIYAPVQDNLAALTEDEATPEEYYDEVVERQRSGGSLLPELALKWAANENELNEALGVVGDLNESDAWLAESKELVETLLKALASEQRAAFFPGLRDVQVKSVEARNTLFALRSRLVAIEKQIVASELSGEQTAELTALAAERRKLEPEYQKLPQRIEEYRTQADSMRGEMRELSRQVHQVD